MTKKIRFVRAMLDGTERLFELGTIKSNSINIDESPRCPHCLGRMSALLDMIQYGYIEDKFIVLFACGDCNKAYWYSYTLSMIAPAFPLQTSGKKVQFLTTSSASKQTARQRGKNVRPNAGD